MAPLTVAGVLGVLPAGTTDVSLVSWGRAATTTLTYAAGADRLDIDLDGTVHSFDLTGVADAAAVAAGLAGGTLRSDGDATLSSLGLTVAADGGGVVFTRPGSVSPAAVALSGPGVAVTGTQAVGEAAGGTIQVITRDGRHIAGVPLSPSEAAALLTEANGFRAGAVYDPTPLRADDGPGYRGTLVDIAAVPGDARIALPGGLVSAAGLPLAAAASRTITLSDAGTTRSVTLPQGASAATAAGLIGGALPGLSARAVTALELSDLPDGAMSFALQGANTGPVNVSAAVTGGDGGALAQAVNALSGATGIRAELSPDGRRVLLVQDDGHDITLSALQPGGGGSLRLRPAGPDGTATGAGTVMSGGAVRQGGQVILSGTRAFQATEGAATLGSTTGPGRWRSRLSPPGPARACAPERCLRGPTAGGVFTLDVGGVTTVATVPAGTSAQDAAALLARVCAALRRMPPSPAPLLSPCQPRAVCWRWNLTGPLIPSGCRVVFRWSAVPKRGGWQRGSTAPTGWCFPPAASPTGAGSRSSRAGRASGLVRRRGRRC